MLFKYEIIKILRYCFNSFLIIFWYIAITLVNLNCVTRYL